VRERKSLLVGECDSHAGNLARPRHGAEATRSVRRVVARAGPERATDVSARVCERWGSARLAARRGSELP
jgi:hypothetical protein